MTEGKILIGMMDKYDNDLMSALGVKQREVFSHYRRAGEGY